MIETLLRVTLPLTQTQNYQPYGQGVYSTVITIPIEGYGPYYEQWTSSGVNAKRVVIGSVLINLEGYIKKSSLADCLGDDKSFYWANQEQTLYIHFEFDKIPEISSIFLGILGGFSHHAVQYIDGVEYLPRISKVPSIKNKVDKFQAGKMRFTDQSVQLINSDAGIDGFIQNPVPGSEASIVLYDTETSTELQYFTGIVSGDGSTYDTFTLKMIDKRRRDNKKIPNTRYDTTTYTDLESKYAGKIIHEGYGALTGIKCTPLNGEVGSGNIEFKYATDATVLTEVRVKEDDVWSVVTALNSAPSTGYFELSYADATNAAGAILDCVCDATLRAEVTPGDIIADMNTRYSSVTYDASNYNTTEWAAEDAKLSNISLLMDKEQEIYKYIEQIQNGTNLWFVYYIQGDGKRTIRVNDPDRASSGTIPYDRIKDDNKAVTRDFSEFSSTVTVLYSEDHQTGVFERVEIDDYEEAVVSKYLVEQNDEYASLLGNLTDATEKADVIAEDQSEARPVITITLHEAELSELVYKLYDVVSVDLSRPARKCWCAVLDEVYFDHSSTDEIYFDYTATDEIYFSPGEFRDDPTQPPAREYWGTIRGQIIGITYNPGTLDYTLTIRERPESEVL